MKKFILPLFLFAFLMISCTPKDVKLTGRVTYISTYTASLLPDEFAKIFILNKTNVEQSDHKDIFHNILAFRILKSEYSIATAKELNNEADSLKIKLDIVAEYVMKDMIWMEMDERTIANSCDINGNFTQMLKPGNYYVIAVSAHRTGMTLADINGYIDIDPVEIKRNEEKQIRINF